METLILRCYTGVNNLISDRMNGSLIKFFSLLFLLGLLAGACTSLGAGDRAARERTPFARAPLGGALPSLPSAVERQVPSLEDLFGRFQEEEIRIALLLPLSGPGESTGNAFLDAAAMALFESYDPRLQLFPYDTGGTPEGARRAAREAVGNDPDIVIGPLFAASIAAAAPIVRAGGLNMIGFSNNREVAGNGVYLLSFLPSQEVERVIAYAAAQGHDQFAALIPDSPYGAAALEGFSRSVFLSGKAITGLEIYERDTQTVFDPVRRLANYDQRRGAYLDEERFLEALGDDDLAKEILKGLEPFETLGEPPFSAVLVPEGGQFLRSLVPLLPFFEVDPLKVQFLGTGLWYDPTLPGEPTLEGAWFAGPDPAKVEDFMARFKGLYGYRPPRIVTLSYDAISLVATLARIEFKRARFSGKTLQNANGFEGLDGIFRFRGDGTSERRFAILEIRRQGFFVVSPAPSSFQDVP